MFVKQFLTNPQLTITRDFANSVMQTNIWSTVNNYGIGKCVETKTCKFKKGDR